jgi:hypothetical protein
MVNSRAITESLIELKTIFVYVQLIFVYVQLMFNYYSINNKSEVKTQITFTK